MKLTRLLKCFFTLAVMALCTQAVSAQEGNLQGTLLDENGLKIPFGSVMIESLQRGAISDADGKFFLLGLPAGDHTLKVVFLGYADQELPVSIQADETTSVVVRLEQQAEQLEGVMVLGSNGTAKALNAQRNKQNITNIVSTDQIGKYPDANIGDAVKRIPGITMQVDQGEARNIIVRGLAPQLNSVTLNGSRIPSAEGDNRNVQMDLIPSDMIQTIEVNKAVTPDMDADALGGSVNLVTRSSPQNFRLAATVGGGINFITDKRILNASFLVGDRSANEKFGWMASASIHDSDFGSHNVEAEWENEAEVEIDGEDEDIEVAPYVGESDIRTYLVQRIRRSFSVNLDYAFDANNTIYLKSMYNWRDDRENRFRLRYRKIAPVFADDNSTITGYEGEIRRQTKGGLDNNRNKNTRLEDQRMQNYSLSGDHLFGSLKMDWMASYAAASEERLNERYIEYELGDAIGLNHNVSNPRYPFISPANAPDASLDNFELKEITEENQFTEEKDFNAFLNFELPTDLFGQGDGTVKFGGRLRSKNKDRDNNFYEFSPTGDEFDTMSDQPLRNISDPDFLAGAQYQAGEFVDQNFLGGLNLNDGSRFEKEDVPDEYVRANYDVSEKVYGGYVMVDQPLSSRLNLLAGIRLEHTYLEATGNEIQDEEEVIGTITETNSYTNILPSIHLKYDLTDKTILRLAWTNTLARPNYADLVPSEDTIEEDEEIFRGNPDLDATTSMNFDLMAEHYFNNVGIISGGLFYKDINDFIYTYQSEDAATGYNVFQPQNGDKASVFGAEVSFQRQLDFLPGFAKNFSLMLNYTYLTSSADGIRNEDGEERTDLDLPGTSPNMFNGSLAYAGKKLNLRLSVNYSDAYLDEIGGSAFTDRYYDKQFLMDFNASYAVNKNLSVYMDLNNMTNQALRYYQGHVNRTMQMEYYGRRLTFGLKYNLFGKQ